MLCIFYTLIAHEKLNLSMAKHFEPVETMRSVKCAKFVSIADKWGDDSTQNDLKKVS